MVIAIVGRPMRFTTIEIEHPGSALQESPIGRDETPRDVGCGVDRPVRVAHDGGGAKKSPRLLVRRRIRATKATQFNQNR